MAQFRAEIEGNGRPVSRLGTSHIFADVDAWHSGIQVRGTHTDTGEIRWSVWRTNGSIGGGQDKLLAAFVVPE